MADHSDDLHLDQLLDSASEDFQNLNLSKPSLERSKEAVETKREPPSLPSGVQGLGVGLPDLRTMKKGKRNVSGGSHVTEALDKQFEEPCGRQELCFWELFPVCMYIWISKLKQKQAFNQLMLCKIRDGLTAIEEGMKQEFLVYQWRRQQIEEETIRLRAEGERLRAEMERLRAEREIKGNAVADQHSDEPA
ncbi:hypothetical protein M0R45_024749 [Rubus argutus]|uniref:Uncharacterized protein n=1 Tax=Rubus argutus TaxID=59490 RepID=A0AAW1WV77_RUBAR